MIAHEQHPCQGGEIYNSFTARGFILWYDKRDAKPPERMEAVITIENVSKRYGSVRALDEVSLCVEKGSVLGLLGQNGAGKTTLLNILTGYLAPTAGRVLIDGRDVLLEPAQAKRHLGYLPEQPPLYDEMTVREYLCFASELRGVEKRAIAAHVDEVMELTGLTAMRNRLISHLSKGYRQRTGMAQALCGDPDVLVLDEPTVGLDPKQITEIRSLIRTLGSGRTIVFSSHILSEVQQLCTQVAILEAGRIRLDAPMGQVHSGDEITLLVTVAAGESSVIHRLKALDGVRRIRVQPTAQMDRTTVLITFYRQAEPERRLFGLMSGLGIPILHLSRSEDSLEQVFLNTISQ